MHTRVSFRHLALEQGWSRSVEASRWDVYIALVELAAGSAVVQASFNTLADVSGRSRPLVLQAVRDLESAGVIAHSAPIKDPVRQQPSSYALL